ncbi:MAG: FGGY family carbohydrate kinase, partial [Acidimicrobiales bacterium]
MPRETASGVLLGIDVGTTSVKVVVMSPAGHIAAEAASSAIPTASPAPGAAEQDAEDIWQALVQAVRGAVAKLPDRRVLAVSMAVQSGSVVPIGNDRRAAGPVVLWMDTRSVSVVESWGPELAREIREISGWTAAPGLGLSTLAWFQHAQPASSQDATRFASVDAYLMYRLTGLWVTNPSNAAGMQLMDVAERTWSDTLCSVAGISSRQLPAIEATGNTISALSPEASQATGLAPDTAVVAGGHDQACAAYGLGVRDPGTVLLSAGTAWVATAPTEHGDVSRLPAQLNLSPHVQSNTWTASQSLGGLGAMIAWWRDEICRDAQCIERDLGNTVPHMDAPLFVPALDDEQRTAWGHFDDGVVPRDDPGRSRSVIEAAAFGVRSALVGLDEAIG